LGDETVECLLFRQTHQVIIESEKDQRHVHLRAFKNRFKPTHVFRGRNRPVTGFSWIFQLEMAEKHSATQFGGFPKHKRAFPDDITRGD
jgi:hypothetical protein